MHHCVVAEKSISLPLTVYSRVWTDKEIPVFDLSDLDSANG